MPKDSIRKQTIKTVNRKVEKLALSDDDEEELFEMTDLLFGLETTRVLNSSLSIPKLSQFREYILKWHDEEFINTFRMEKRLFEQLVDKIKDHSVFHNNSSRKQADVYIQLALTLKRFGHDGTGNSVNQLAAYFGISKGSVGDFTKRCMIAIEAKLGTLVTWPNREERALTSKRIQHYHYFRNCIGYVDGTHLKLSQKPTIDGETYFNRKKDYSLNCQIFCDERRIIFGVQLGYPGSVSDATCLNNSIFLRNENQTFFSTEGNHEYLLGDSGYALHPFVLTPYRRPQVAGSDDNRDFNLVHSSARVAVENAIGMLKGRWRFFKNIPIQMKQPKDIEKIDDILFTCVILHNYLIIEGDSALMDYENELEVEDERDESQVLILERFNSDNIPALNQWKESVRDILLRDHTLYHQ